MKKVSKIGCTFLLGAVVVCGCGGANGAILPEAFAVAVHLCAAAEANAWLARPKSPPGTGAGPVDKVTITLERESKLAPSITIASNGGSPGEEDGHKTVAVEADGLPTAKQCRAAGYERQMVLGFAKGKAPACKDVLQPHDSTWTGQNWCDSPLISDTPERPAPPPDKS